MPKVTCTHIEVYPFRRRRAGVEFLALRRSPGRSLPGVWQPVTGKISGSETALQAAVREVREETGLQPEHWWALETMSVFFEYASDEVRTLPLFAVELQATDTVRLSDEHDDFRFVQADEAEKLFLWNAQRTGLRAVRDEVLAGGALAEALAIPLERITA